MNIYFGENLKGLRQQMGLTQKSLAELLGMSFQTISKWERGEAYPDLAMLPEIAELFKVSIDELLGINRAENEKRAEAYIEMYESMHFKNIFELLNQYKKAIKEFPNDFRILVRYMQILTNIRIEPFIKVAEVEPSEGKVFNPYKNGLIRNPDYDRMSGELKSIYENIQNRCTDDGIRIWSKHIMINHLMNKYCLSFDEKQERWRCDTDSLNKAQGILETMPTLCDARELLEASLCQSNEEFTTICKRNIEELSFLLQGEIRAYCYYPYDNSFPAEYKIKVIENMNGIFDITDNDNYISKNRPGIIYNYGHLGHLYAETGNNERAIEYLKLCAEKAKELDSHPNEADRILRYYELGRNHREMSMCQRIKELMMRHYPLTDEFRARADFKQIIEYLEQ